jgi:hypothetical protein
VQFAWESEDASAKPQMKTKQVQKVAMQKKEKSSRPVFSRSRSREPIEQTEAVESTIDFDDDFLPQTEEKPLPKPEPKSESKKAKAGLKIPKLDRKSEQEEPERFTLREQEQEQEQTQQQAQPQPQPQPEQAQVQLQQVQRPSQQPASQAQIHLGDKLNLDEEQSKQVAERLKALMEGFRKK